ncbi:MAG: EAL domain-containing protein [Gaiella sp.]
MAVNAGWSRFAEENGGANVGVGSAYLAVCDEAEEMGDQSAGDAARLIRGVMGGDPEPGLLHYHCDSPSVRRRFLMRVAAGAAQSVVVMHFDVTEGAETDERLRVQDAVLGEIDAAVMAFDQGLSLTFWNTAAERLFGLSRADVLGTNVLARLEPGRPSGGLREHLGEVAPDEAVHGVFDMKGVEGETLSVQVDAKVVLDVSGSTIGAIVVASDIRERIWYERELRSARDYLAAVMVSIPDGLCTVDGDGFVLEVNRAAEHHLGWTAADLGGCRLHDVLHAAAERDDAHSFDDCPITKAGAGDEAVIVADDSFVCRDGTQLTVAYKAAPVEAISGRHGVVVVFRDTTEEKAERDRQRLELLELSWAARVREALETDAFTLYAQPIIEIATGKTVQYELLLRMLSKGQVILPGEFLPAAAHHGLLIDIDRWVVQHAAELAAGGHPVAINISAQSLSQPVFSRYVEEVLASTGVDPSLIVIEVTETDVVENQGAASDLLGRLTSLGCKVALDDFGTGYGGFLYLKRLTVHILKIDREFVTDLDHNDTNRAVIQAIVGLAEAFGQHTIAEGIEDEPTLRAVADLGVKYGQGYLFGRPAPAADILVNTEGDTRGYPELAS